MRGVSAAGGTNAEGNHSGPLPQVGTYLDEQPVTTIGGTLDIHIYDIARIESLAGPQGTLYGASSEAGTIRIITNKPELGVTSGRIDGEINSVAHGGMGGKLEGMINLPIGPTHRLPRQSPSTSMTPASSTTSSAARTYCGDTIYDEGDDAVASAASTTGSTVNQRRPRKRRISTTRTCTADGRRSRSTSTTIGPSRRPSCTRSSRPTASSSTIPSIGDLKIDRFRKETSKDRFWQAALTIQGKIANFDVTYAGAYMDRPTFGINDYADYTDAYDQLYENVGGLAYYFYSPRCRRGNSSATRSSSSSAPTTSRR